MLLKFESKRPSTKTCSFFFFGLIFGGLDLHNQVRKIHAGKGYMMISEESKKIYDAYVLAHNYAMSR